ncbi:ATP-binding protein [Providencia vermicola]|uniref:histidine kinase n=1 Tax=Providencia vermicola TaxID=333965 RepID=A0AAX3S548_9GAMM|nr:MULTISPECIES: ATP-binding protein [Providencia]MTB38996.1 two-component sensor histidine kinase [Providencia sp. wls1949]MTC07230.1 two-component sensor histidine kinase [Providencia sp. wls1948]ELR5119602.1 two-component sensor histidine kinase [Providencia stuartii]ELR5141347.1 two-component sensor histidine kinase [Providencia stuartii]ELX8379710.1 two-component sensor histidine kinase [Providencia stuartii]
MKVKSFFIYTFFLQISSVILLWVLLVGWLQFFYLPDIDDDFNLQQQIVTEGFASTLGTVANNPEYFERIMTSLQKMYTDAMENGLEVSYRPFVAVRNQHGDVLYRNSDQIKITDNILFNDLKKQYPNWHFTFAWNDEHSIEVILGESYFDRKSIIGSPAEGTAIPLLFILGIMLIAIIITAYFSLRPLRQAATIIASRKPGNLTPISVKEQYKEIRPIITAINNLMSRVDAANQREKRFMADAAHELRTPIAAVIAQLHLLMQIQNVKEKEEIVNDMQAALNRAASLSHQLIDLARLEAEDFSVNKEQINLPVLISHITSLHVPHAINQDIDIELQSADNVFITTDKLALTTIFTNLLENAIKYSDKKGKIKITIKDLSPFGATITVQDNGRGIPEESRQLIFSRFYRVPGTTETGSGLGLSIVHNLATKIDAAIRVTDGLDKKGVGFIIDLP